MQKMKYRFLGSPLWGTLWNKVLDSVKTTQNFIKKRSSTLTYNWLGSYWGFHKGQILQIDKSTKINKIDLNAFRWIKLLKSGSRSLWLELIESNKLGPRIRRSKFIVLSQALPHKDNEVHCSFMSREVN